MVEYTTKDYWQVVNRKILFVGTAFPPAKAGSAVVMRELLKQLDPDSYRVIAMASDGRTDDADFESHVLRLGSRMFWARRFSMWIRMFSVFLLYFRAMKYARGFNPDVVVAVYPSLDFLYLGGLIARGLNVRFVSYLHDTIADAHKNGLNYLLAKWVQRFAFKTAAKVAVMSEGMAELYKRRYGMDTISVPHVYAEKVVNEGGLKPRNMDVFWAGSVYGINGHAVKRVFDAAQECKIQFVFTARESKDRLAHWGISGDCLTIKDIPTRGEYLNFIQGRGICLLALDFPDETKVGENELATIFPTKTPEFLASGVPILVHCPDHYFLARFFREHRCGMVISSRDVRELAKGLLFLMKQSRATEEMVRNAKDTLRMFSPLAVLGKFEEATGCAH